MKRLWTVAIVGVLSLSAAAQTRGIPASVTSITPTRSVSGIPAGVTSLGHMGPTRYGTVTGSGYQHNRNFGGYNSMCSTPGALIPSAMGCTSTYFTNSMYGLSANAGHTNLRPRGRRNGGNGAYYPVYVPYTVPVVVEPEEPQPSMEAVTGDAAEEDNAEEPPAYTVFERRPTSAVNLNAAPIDENRVYHPHMTQAEDTETSKLPPIVIVYKDGHQRDVQNYAIVGQYLYDISGFSSQKIALADLDLKATSKANEERGSEFYLPSSVSQ